MSEFSQFADVLIEKATGTLKGSARIDVPGEGSVMLSASGGHIGEGSADVILTASRAVFQAIMAGTQNPIMAVMSGKLKVDGSQMRALKVSEILTA